jgi:hypothetical protein
VCHALKNFQFPLKSGGCNKFSSRNEQGFSVFFYLKIHISADTYRKCVDPDAGSAVNQPCAREQQPGFSGLAGEMPYGHPAGMTPEKW